MKVGPLNAIFKITMEICDPVEEEGYTMKGTSKAGALGFASGEADIRLQDLEDNGCELNYDAKIRVGGKIAQLGARLMGSVSKKFIDDFFIAFEEGINAESEPATSESDC